MTMHPVPLVMIKGQIKDRQGRGRAANPDNR